MVSVTKAEPSRICIGDIVAFKDRIEDLIDVTKKTSIGASNEDEKNFVRLVANKLQNLSLMLQKEMYKRKKDAK